MSYYIFGFLDAENKPDESNQRIDRIIDGINQNTGRNQKYSRNDKYLSWKYPVSNKNELEMESISPKRAGIGLLATLSSALAFEVFENSELMIDIFRKNSG